jgi:hypothetical protein
LDSGGASGQHSCKRLQKTVVCLFHPLFNGIVVHVFVVYLQCTLSLKSMQKLSETGLNLLTVDCRPPNGNATRNHSIDSQLHISQSASTFVEFALPSSTQPLASSRSWSSEAPLALALRFGSFFFHLFSLASCSLLRRLIPSSLHPLLGGLQSSY